ncbi:hypothetical protein [Pelomonas sp. KK5]|uniref:O-linked N-acetylglucosamine transferase, SPINDLY family protein n=1 Tax=Pelomonas sp. KK5 TaxID=1855730 RepID=UPI00097C6382|nr:hypothetical protein [Pelomonas sp. KK5]
MTQPAALRLPRNRQQVLDEQARRCWDAGQRAAGREQWNAAAAEYQQAIELAPQDPLYPLSLAGLRLKQGLPAAAEAPARRALELAPSHALACRMLARVLRELRRADEAAAVFDACVPAAAPDADYLFERGEALLDARRAADAIPVLLQALHLNMFNALGHHRLGVAFQLIDRPRDAAVCFETAAVVDKGGELKPLALSQLVHELQRAGEWGQLATHVAALVKQLDEAGDGALAQVTAFSLLMAPVRPAQQLRVARLNSQALTAGIAPLPPAAARPPREGRRLRIGYLSSDFHNHATALLVAELLELHDRERFEVLLYCHSPEDGSALQQRVRAAADSFRDVRHVADVDLARRMREDGVDIAVDLKSHTRDTRFRALAWRPAPVQVGFLGFPGTSGAGFIDYLVGDRIVTPQAHAAHFSEQIAQLPHSYQPNDSRRALPLAPSRAELGLPEQAPVLACFNQSTKITPEAADAWGQVLRAVPDAVLWLLSWNPVAEANLRSEMALRGVDASRLVFAPLVDAAGNLARLQCADLFLDTWPCNAHTTASEALWAGVPVLTVPGATFASRVAASLVAACELPQFICPNVQAYVDRAVALCHDMAALRRAQLQLRERRLELPLFDSRRYARDFEALLDRMWARHEAGLAPEFLAAAS